MCRKIVEFGVLPLVVLVAFVSPVSGVDLIVTSVDIAGLSFDCQVPSVSGTVSAVVKNDGINSTTASFTVLFFDDKNGNGTYEPGVDLYLGSDTVADPVGPGQEVTVTTPVNAAVTFAGDLVYTFADSDNDIIETDETNNIWDSGKECQFEPVPGPFSLVEEWNWNSSSTYSSHVQVMMTPIVANITDDNGDSQIDDDDVPDVVFSCFSGSAYGANGVVRAVNGDDGSEIFTTPLTSDLDVLGEGSLAIGDIDGDGMPEIIANEDVSETHNINSYGRLIVFEHDGTFKFKSFLMNDGRLRWGGAALADLNADGTPEIIVGRHILDNNGALVAKGTGRKGDNGVGPLSTVADIDRDGTPDIVAGFTVYEVLIDGANNISGMNIKWEAKDPNGAVISGDGFPAVANFDADDHAEVVVVSKGSVWLFDDDGSHIWGPSAIPGGGSGGPPNCDDFDNDGEVEVGTAGQARYAVYDTDGTLLWSQPTFDTSSNVTGSSVFDFEGDGSAEVVYKDQTFLRVYRGTDGFVLASVATGSGTTYENPVIADVDRDGNAEIIICANNYAYGTRRGIQVFGDANDMWVNTRRIWNQHTYHITNVNDDATIPVNEEDNWLTYNSFRSQEEKEGVVFAAPDITASYIRMDNSLCPDTVGLVARIGNGGAIVGAPPINVAFFDGDPDAGGVLLGVAQTTQALDPGQYEDVVLFVSPPLDGTHTIFVSADDDGSGIGTVSECDETNNRCAADLSDFCVLVVTVDLDIKPRSCPNPLNVKIFEKPPKNAMSKKGGVLPVAILGTSDFEVSDIDVSTLLLEGVPPLRHNLEDVAVPVSNGEECECTTGGPDGYMDLTLKFLKGEIANAIGTVSNGDIVPLTITGTLLDGTPIEGSDCVWILSKEEEPGITSMEGDVELGPAVPNPFNPITQISYYIPGDEFVKLSIFDVTGKLVQELVAQQQPAGKHIVEWDADGMPSGLYFYRLKAGGKTLTKKMILLK